jgi:hypothetical protein
MDYFNRRRINPADVKDLTMANTFYDRLQEQISAAQAQLYEGEQLAVYYQGQVGSPIQVTNLGYHNPSLIKLFGKNESAEDCLVLAHMNSVQLLLVVEKTDASSPKRTIGFVGQSSPDANDEESGPR